jgi:queuine tRNA-ribosyltransferase catalytic subunit
LAFARLPCTDLLWAQYMDCRADDLRPIEEGCPCETCSNYTRAAIHAALSTGAPAGATLVSTHNVAFMQNLTFAMRKAIKEGTFPTFVKNFMEGQFSGDYPHWLRNALKHVGIDL